MLRPVSVTACPSASERNNQCARRWGREFLYNCHSPETLQRTSSFLENNSPYFCQLTYDIAKKEGLCLDGSTTGALTLFMDTGIPGDPQAMFDAAVANAGRLVEKGHKIDVLDAEAVLALEPSLTANAQRIAGAPAHCSTGSCLSIVSRPGAAV